MNNDKIINDLEKFKVDSTNTIITLIFQGYLVNNKKLTKLNYNTILTNVVKHLVPVCNESVEFINSFYNNIIIL